MVQSRENVNFDEFLCMLGDKVNRGISIIVYSDPGIGKTTLSTTLPEKETLIINTECGMGPLLGTKHITFNLRQAIINGHSVEDAMTTLYRRIRTKDLDVKNVVIDNISELIDLLKMHYTKTHGKDFPEMREQGETAYKILSWIHEWRDLQELGINVVFNAWEIPYKIQQENNFCNSKIAPMVGEASCRKICGLVDIVAHLECHEKTGVRWLRISPSRQYITKSQFLGLDFEGEKPDLPYIFNKIKSYDYSNRKGA